MRLSAVPLAAPFLFAATLRVMGGELVFLESRASFRHAAADLSYAQHWQGSLELDLDADSPGALVAGFFLGLGEPACNLFATWQTNEQAGGLPTAPVEICLVKADANEASFSQWVSGKGGKDPTLRVKLLPVSNRPGEFINPEPVQARILVRRCGSFPRQFIRYATLSIPSGTLKLVHAFDPDLPKTELLVSSAAITDVDALAWQEIGSECGNAHLILPAVPVAGETTSWSAVSFPRSQNDTPGTAALDDDVASIVAGGGLSRFQGQRLARSLDQVAASVRKGRPEAAMQQLEGFVHRTSELQSRAMLKAQDGDRLRDRAEALDKEITTTAFGIPAVLPTPQLCLPSTPCSPRAFYVRSSFSSPPPPGTPDGSRDHPFPSIAAAIGRAVKENVCGVEIRLEPGLYPESVELRLPTWILGQGSEARRPILIGSIVNRGPYRLSIDSATIALSRSPGAVIVDNPCAETKLNDVLIMSPMGFGIRQRGGSLLVRASRVVGVRAVSGDVTPGAGIEVLGGARTVLSAVELEMNGGGALRAIGPQTRVYATRLEVARTRVNPSFFEIIVGGDLLGSAAVEVADGALLLLQWSHIRESELIGLLVRDGAGAHFRFGSVASTEMLEIPGSGPFGGRNIAVHAEAVLQLASFVTEEALVGYQVTHALGKGDDGLVRGNVVGLALSDSHPDLSFDCLVEDVIFPDNERNVDADALPIPDPGLDPVPMPTGVCPQVPWTCDWCGS